MRVFQCIGPRLNGQATGHLAHGFEQRQPPGRICHRLIGNTGGSTVDQIFGLFRVGRQMQLGEENLAIAQLRALMRLWLLHFHNHLCAGEYILR